MSRTEAEVNYEIEALRTDIAILEHENRMLRARNERLMFAFDHVERAAQYLIEQIRKGQS